MCMRLENDFIQSPSLHQLANWIDSFFLERDTDILSAVWSFASMPNVSPQSRLTEDSLKPEGDVEQLSSELNDGINHLCYSMTVSQSSTERNSHELCSLVMTRPIICFSSSSLWSSAIVCSSFLATSIVHSCTLTRMAAKLAARTHQHRGMSADSAPLRTATPVIDRFVSVFFAATSHFSLVFGFTSGYVHASTCS